MAFDQAYVPIGPTSRLTHIWNVTEAVGKNSPNKREDVMLVQYLLKRLYENPNEPERTKPKGDMTVDGICGPITKNWIVKFQVDLNDDYQGFCTMDGRVDRAHGTKSSILNQYYTIVAMNRFFEEENPDIHADPTQANDMPMELKLKLVSNRLPPG